MGKGFALGWVSSVEPTAKQPRSKGEGNPRIEKRRLVVLGRKNPPFPPEADDEWGTLKFICWVALDRKLKSTARNGRATREMQERRRRKAAPTQESLR